MAAILRDPVVAVVVVVAVCTRPRAMPLAITYEPSWDTKDVLANAHNKPGD